jgi:copper chaperone CopZ
LVGQHSNNPHFMKLVAASIATALTLAFSARAADVKISEVHICCKKCVTGIEKAVGKVDGAKPEVDKDAGTITLTASDNETLQKAVDELTKAGYFGKSSDDAIKVRGRTGATRTGTQVQKLEIEGLHLCCDKCVKGVNEAIKDVPGVKANTAVKEAKTFEITGDFNDHDLFAALHKAGFNGKEVKN